MCQQPISGVACRMTAIAEQLDRRLKAMPPAKAASVSKLVHDLLEVVDAIPDGPTDRAAAIAAHKEHWRKMDAMLAELDWSDFERPDQGVSEIREDW